MAQDDDSGQPTSTGGGAAAPSASDTPDSHEIKAPAQPEAPVTQPTDAAPPAAGGGAPGSGEGKDDAHHDPSTQSGDDLQKAVEDAKTALQDAVDALARHKEQAAAAQAAAELVRQYTLDEPALTQAKEDLKRYQGAETNFLSGFLDQAAKTGIENATQSVEDERQKLTAGVSALEGAAAAKRRERDDAKEKAAAARAEADSLKRPAGSIRDRLKAADAIRSEAKKASDDGKYALAYWLVMPQGKLSRTLAEVQILKPDELDKKVGAAREAQQAAEQALAAAEKALKDAEDRLRDEKLKLVELNHKFDALVLEKVAALNPPIVKAA
jgi:hypothetical protein